MGSRIRGLLVAATLYFSALMKIRDKQQFEDSLEDFGVPTERRGSAAQAVIAAEALVGTLLLPKLTRRLGGFASASLLSAFSGAAGLAISRGKRPACNCFGSLSNKPLSWTLFLIVR